MSGGEMGGRISRDALAGENERLRAIEAAVREWVRRNRVCDVAEDDGALDGDGAMPDGTDCQSWCSEAWDAIEAALASAPAGESEVARLREELRIVSRYAARLYDAMVRVVETIDEGAGRVWHAALKRGREDA